MGIDLEEVAELLEAIAVTAAAQSGDMREATVGRSPIAHDLAVLATELRKVSLLAVGIANLHGLEPVPDRVTLGGRAQPKEQ